jgi:putative holliday junction resolvase
MSNKSLISIDYGTRKSGLAYSVEDFCFAHKTVSTKDLTAYLRKWIPEKKATSIVIGLPLNIDGTESKHSTRVRKFTKELENIFPEQEIILHDERMTTSEARLSSAEDIDAESARLILEDYLREETL